MANLHSLRKHSSKVLKDKKESTGSQNCTYKELQLVCECLPKYIVYKAEVTATDKQMDIVCSCHVAYAFQSESTLYDCLNEEEPLARSKRKISSLSG